jgi:molecular chaperone GrpE
VSRARIDHDTSQPPAAEGTAASEAGADGPQSTESSPTDPGADTTSVDTPLEAEFVEPDESTAAGVNGTADAEVSVEALVGDLERVTAERDQYLDTSRRIQAEFENYRKQVGKRETEARERANDGLVQELLPVLDAFDAALASGVESVSPMRRTMLDTLAKHGLERIDPVGSEDGDEPFDPNLHEAVVHAEGESGQAGPVVAEVMRAGYVWKGRVVRPAMVSVRG